MGMEDITSRQWLPLMILGRCEEAPNLNQLAEKCGITRQSTKQLVDKLVEKGYVTLEKSDADKRNMIIVITDKGRRWGAENLDKNMRFVSELYADISERDIKTFAKVQQKLLNKLYVMKEELSNDTNREKKTKTDLIHVLFSAYFSSYSYLISSLHRSAYLWKLL